MIGLIWIIIGKPNSVGVPESSSLEHQIALVFINVFAILYKYDRDQMDTYALFPFQLRDIYIITVSLYADYEWNF